MQTIPGMRRAARQRGFFLIGLLIVLAIIAILSYKQMGPSGENVKMYTGRAKDVACQLNRSTFVTTLAVWRQSHSGEPMTLENIRASGTTVPTCPNGGVWSLSADGNEIYCSIHNPAPDTGDKAEEVIGSALGMPAVATPQPMPNFAD